MNFQMTEILAETWGCKCDLQCENYFIEYVKSQKHIGVKKGRESGGFIILFKNNLGVNVKIIKKGFPAWIFEYKFLKFNKKA